MDIERTRTRTSRTDSAFFISIFLSISESTKKQLYAEAYSFSSVYLFGGPAVLA
jgi:hypothetical protein